MVGSALTRTQTLWESETNVSFWPSYQPLEVGIAGHVDRDAIGSTHRELSGGPHGDLPAAAAAFAGVGGFDRERRRLCQAIAHRADDLVTSLPFGFRCAGLAGAAAGRNCSGANDQRKV